jgi:hypothetical protein
LLSLFFYHDLGGNLRYYKQLKSATPRNLYRLFDRALEAGEAYRVDVMELAQRIGMSPTYEFPSKVVHKIKSALNELLERGYISSWETDARRGETYLVVRRERTTPYQLNMALAEATAPADTEDEGVSLSIFEVPLVVKELCYYGLGQQEAMDFHTVHGEDILQDCVRAMEQTFLTGELPKNPPDWLRQEIARRATGDCT